MVYSMKFKGQTWYLHQRKDAEIYYFSRKLDRKNALDNLPSSMKVILGTNFPFVKRRR